MDAMESVAVAVASESVGDSLKVGNETDWVWVAESVAESVGESLAVTVLVSINESLTEFVWVMVPVGGGCEMV